MRIGATTRTATVAAAGALLLLGGCSSNSSSEGSMADPGGSKPTAQSEVAPGQAQDKGSTGSGAGSTASPAAATDGEMLARRAHISIQVAGITAAVDRVHAVNDEVGGILLSESLGAEGPGVPTPVPEGAQSSSTTSSADAPSGPTSGSQTSSATPTYAEIVISVPSERLDDVLDELSGLGTLLDKGQSADNVRGQYVDTSSRLKTMRASVNRVRALMDQADSLAQVVRLESELAQREADLEALEARLADLENSVARAPVRISLTTRHAGSDTQDAGFLAGLGAGWDAFTSSAGVLATVLGALTPFVLFAAIVAVPLVWWWRRRRGPATTSA